MTVIARWVALCTIALLSAGCGQGEEVDQMAAALEESRTTIDRLRDEKGRLMARIDRLQETCDALQAEYDNLQIKHRDLTQWSRQLSEKFDPGVWMPGPYERPLPFKPIPDATPDRLADELNVFLRRSRLPQVDLVAIQGRTAHVRVSDERQLTQEMGSAGATGYIQAVTYTLTSHAAVDAVDFDFEEGDHAVPGRYTR